MKTSPNKPKADRTRGTSEEPLEPDWMAILDAVQVGISVHSSTGEILWANSKLYDIYRKSISELQYLTCEQVFHGEASPCPHEEVLATGCGAEFESVMLSSGRTMMITIQPMRREHKAHGFVRIVRDITEDRDARERLLKTERFATLGQVLYAIAHDVGTPLNIISGYSEFLLMRIKPEDPGHKELSAILNQTRRIATLFSEALDLARLPQGRPEALDIKSILTHSLNLAGHFLRKADVRAELTCTKPPPLIYGEASQFTQALFNLLLNAAQKVGGAGRLEIVIDHSADSAEFPAIEFWGTDADGRGHDFSRSLASLFAPFEWSKPVDVGLALARDILEGAAAKITFGEAGERGVPLIIRLPSAQAASSKEQR